MAGHRNKTSKDVLFAVLIALFFFGILDTGYRLFRSLMRRPGQEAIFEPDPVLGRRHVKGASALVIDWYKPAPNRVSINAFGFRGPNPRTLEKPPGVIRVLAQGGSTTEDIFVDDGQTWPEQLQAKLSTRLRTDRIEVINMGTSGYTAQNCVQDLKLNGLRLQPDLVIAYHGVNDFRKTMKERNDLEEVEAYVKYEERQTNWWSRILCHSSILDQINRAYYYQQGTRSRAFTLAYWNEPDKRAVPLTGIEQSTIQALEELLDLSRKHHFQLVIGRQATLMKPTLTEEEATRMWRIFRWKYQGKAIQWESFLEARNRVAEAQAQFAKWHGIRYIDTESWVPKTTEYFVDDAHTGEIGADRISDSFAEGLVRAEVFKDLLGGSNVLSAVSQAAPSGR
jgi:lysophospholipase L1-like esterase